MLPLRVRVDLGALGSEGLLRIAQSSSITRAVSSDCLMSYPRHSLGEEGYSSTDMKSVYSTAPIPADCAACLRERRVGE